MKIDWTPSTEVIAKAKEVFTRHEKGDSFRVIARDLNHSYQYIFQLYWYYRREVFGQHETA